MPTLSKLEEITDLRSIWPNEATNFTPWLYEEENMTLLSDAVGIDINVEEKESSVGDFSVDIYATENGTNKKVIIENQLEYTNHDHLGKLITYASGKSANYIIWIVKHARDEHKAAIEWLNNHTDDEIGFFLCEIKLYKIGDSNPAVKFEVVEKPNDWSKAIRHNENNNETQQLRFDYWTALMDYYSAIPKYSQHFKRHKASKEHWSNFAIGSSRCFLEVCQIQSRNELVVGVYISDDKPLFHALYSHKEEIDALCGPLDWRELPDKKASRIMLIKPDVDFANRSDWNNQFEFIMENLLNMRNAFRM